MTAKTKLTAAQERFLDFLRRFPHTDFPYPNAVMKALIKKGVIEVDTVKTTPSGAIFKTYRQVA